MLPTSPSAIAIAIAVEYTRRPCFIHSLPRGISAFRFCQLNCCVTSINCAASQHIIRLVCKQPLYPIKKGRRQAPFCGKQSLLERKVVIESDRERGNAFVRETTYSLRTRPQTVRAIGIVTYHGIERIDFRVLRQGMKTADRELGGAAVARTVKVVSHGYRRLQRVVSDFAGRA